MCIFYHFNALNFLDFLQFKYESSKNIQDNKFKLQFFALYFVKFFFKKVLTIGAHCANIYLVERRKIAKESRDVKSEREIYGSTE